MTILIVAGDPSGDLHAANLAAALKAARPDLKIAAVGGQKLRAVADEFIEDLASRGVTGFWEPVLKIGFLFGLLKHLKVFLEKRRPEAVVCVDYYGFNRRVLGLAFDAGVPAYYFISPQVWASRPGRVEVLKKLVRKMFVIFPFEAELYAKAGVPVSFVGHPLLDLLPNPKPIAPVEPPLQVGILPGSRLGEVSRHLPVMIEAFLRFKRHFPQSRPVVFASSHLPDSAYGPGLAVGAELVREQGYSRRRAMDLALCSSGTATLENALLGIPMVVVYKMSWPTYAVARAIISVPYIAMANLLAGKELLPELIQHRATGGAVARAAIGLMEDPRHYAALREELLALRGKLGEKGAVGRAAAQILSEILQEARA